MDGKDAYNSQKMQYHIYNMICVKKNPQTNCVFSKLTYINAKKIRSAIQYGKLR